MNISLASVSAIRISVILKSFSHVWFSSLLGCRSHPVLIQGETSVGKTSLIKWLAAATGNQCVRINNHEHTDIQEYLGCYSSDNSGKLMFKEGTDSCFFIQY